MNLLRLKEIQDERSLSNVALAKRVNVTPATISNINKGNDFPKPELLKRIAAELDIDIRELFYQTKDEAPVNGFVEFEGKIYKIQAPEDLERLSEEIKKAGNK